MSSRMTEQRNACMAMQAEARSRHGPVGNLYRTSVLDIRIKTVDAISSSRSIHRMNTASASRTPGSGMALASHIECAKSPKDWATCTANGLRALALTEDGQAEGPHSQSRPAFLHRHTRNEERPGKAGDSPPASVSASILLTHGLQDVWSGCANPFGVLKNVMPVLAWTLLRQVREHDIPNTVPSRLLSARGLMQPP